MFLPFDFLHSKVPDYKCHKEKAAHAISYTHQTTGTCAAVGMCNRTHQMDKTGARRKFHAEPVCFFINLLKALLTCTFVCLLLSSFDFSSYSSELRERYTLRLLCC